MGILHDNDDDDDDKEDDVRRERPRSLPVKEAPHRQLSTRRGHSMMMITDQDENDDVSRVEYYGLDMITGK